MQLQIQYISHARQACKIICVLTTTESSDFIVGRRAGRRAGASAIHLHPHQAKTDAFDTRVTDFLQCQQCGTGLVTHMHSCTVSKADSSADNLKRGAGAGAGAGGEEPNKVAKLLKSGMPPAAPGAPVMAALRRSAACSIWSNRGDHINIKLKFNLLTIVPAKTRPSTSVTP